MKHAIAAGQVSTARALALSTEHATPVMIVPLRRTGAIFPKIKVVSVRFRNRLFIDKRADSMGVASKFLRVPD